MNKTVDYSDAPHSVKEVHWRVDRVEEELDKECSERKDADKLYSDKIESMTNMLIYQLCATILTLVIIIFMFVTGK